jgi:hypothetical protein
MAKNEARQSKQIDVPSKILFLYSTWHTTSVAVESSEDFRNLGTWHTKVKPVDNSRSHAQDG